MPLTLDQIKTAQTANPPVYDNQGIQTNLLPTDTAPPSPVIAADQLNTVQPQITLPQGNISAVGANMAMAGTEQASNSLATTIKELTPPVTPESTQDAALRQSLSDLYTQDTGKAQELVNQETNLGLPDLRKQLNNINGQILVGNAEYKQLQTAYDKLNVENRGKPITMGSIIGNEAQINYARNSELNTKAADVNLLIARGQALQGNISAAETTAQKAVDLKFAAIEDQINTKQQQLVLIQPLLDKQQQIQAAALQKMYADQKDNVARQKAAELQLQNIGISAAANGAPQNIINQALATKDPIQATQILATFIKGNLETTGNLTQGTLFKVPTATQLGGAQFYKYPTSGQVYTSNGTAVDLPTFKQLTNQQNVPDNQVNFSGIKNINPTTASQETIPVDLKPTADTSGEIKAWLIANKRANADIPYYDLWGKLADELTKQGLNPSNYDKVFWEALHPEGLAGYNKYIKDSSGGIDYNSL